MSTITDEITIREFIKNYDDGKYDSPDRGTQIDAGWYDWFCKDTSLVNKTHKLVKKLKQIIKSHKFSIDSTYVFFKNNCPMVGSLYDDFRICDIKTGNVLYTITPRSGHRSDEGAAEVWGHENGFEEPLVHGRWKDVKDFFMV
jgi:hypothetical protein